MAYKHAMAAANLEVDESFFKACDYGEEGGYKGLKSLLRKKKVPTAIFALEDNIAVGAITAAQENSLRVPEDLSVIGSGDRFPVSNVKIPLTTFSDKLEETGALCLEMIDRKLKGKVIKNPKITLKSELIIRNSCAKRKTGKDE